MSIYRIVNRQKHPAQSSSSATGVVAGTAGLIRHDEFGKGGSWNRAMKGSNLVAENITIPGKTSPPARLTLASPGRAGAAETQKQPWSARLLRIVPATHILAVADQAVVSGASFVTTVIIGRWTLPSEFGAYSLGISLVLLWLCVQESLILLPYIVRRHQHPPDARAHHAGSTLTLSCLLSAIASVVLMVTAVGLAAGKAMPEFVTVIWALAGVVPFVLLREFGRAFSLAHLRMAHTLVLDLALAAVQLAGLGWLAWTEHLSAITACAAIGVASAVTSLVWLYIARGNFAIRASNPREATKQSWHLGKWLFANHLVISLQGITIYSMLAYLVGAVVTASYAACMSIALITNPLIIGLGNILAPRAVAALAEGGRRRLLREAIQDAALLGAATSAFCVVVLLFGEQMIELLYQHREYDGLSHTVVVLSLGMLALAVGMPAMSALTSMERQRWVFWTGSVGAATTIVLLWCLVPRWGLVGAAYAFLAGNLVRSVGRWAIFLPLVSKIDSTASHMQISQESMPTAVVQVLQEFDRNFEYRGWIFERLSEGVQAVVYSIQPPNGQPICQEDRSLVLKLYKPAVTPNVEMVQGQFEELSRLHDAMDGLRINGWKISIPAPLYLCGSPLALVMTAVPGTKLSECMESANDLTAAMLDSLARTVVVAMNRCWSIGHTHGDLAPHNILYDGQTMYLSFVDAGAHTTFFACDKVSDGWHPASHDLAHILFDFAVCTPSISNSIVRLRKQLFAECLVRAFIETIDTVEEKLRLLDEIKACTWLHFEALNLSWTPRGLWHLVLRTVATHRIDKLLADLRTRPVNGSHGARSEP